MWDTTPAIIACAAVSCLASSSLLFALTRVAHPMWSLALADLGVTLPWLIQSVGSALHSWPVTGSVSCDVLFIINYGFQIASVCSSASIALRMLWMMLARPHTPRDDLILCGCVWGIAAVAAAVALVSLVIARRDGQYGSTAHIASAVCWNPSVAANVIWDLVCPTCLAIIAVCYLKVIRHLQVVEFGQVRRLVLRNSLRYLVAFAVPWIPAVCANLLDFVLQHSGGINGVVNAIAAHTIALVGFMNAAVYYANVRDWRRRLDHPLAQGPDEREPLPVNDLELERREESTDSSAYNRCTESLVDDYANTHNAVLPRFLCQAL